MKVILTDEVRGLGGRGEVVTVKDGYARNYLLPKQLAREATPGNLKAAEHEKNKWAALTKQEVEGAQEIAAELADVRLVVYKRAGAEGTLFGSVTAVEIAEALAGKGIKVDKRRIETAHPIKSLGEHNVDLHLHRAVVAKFTVDVQPLGEDGRPEKAAVVETTAPEAEVDASTEAPSGTEGEPEAEAAETSAEPGQ